MESYPVDQKPLPTLKMTYLPSPQGPTSRQSPKDSLSPGQHSSSASPPAIHSGSVLVPKVRRRNRLITSCLECRRRKLKCDKTSPCINCTKIGRECVFLSKEMDLAGQSRLAEIKEKVGSLERQLERDFAKPSSPTFLADRRQLEEEEDALPGAEDEKHLEPTPLAVVDAAYEDDGEDDELLDLGIQIGRMRITERIGGFVRPKMSEELAASMKLKADSDATHAESPMQPQTFFSRNFDFMKPGPAYIAPASGLLFGRASLQATWQTFLPQRQPADRLIRQYFDAVHPIAKIVHRPSFERDYGTFWQHASHGIEPAPSLQAIVFAAMFSGVVSMAESAILREFGVPKQNLIENFKNGVETALSRANFLRTTKVATLQGFVMYMIPLCREELSRAHSVLVGAAIRMAECMGLHRDGSHYGLNPVETHVRRMVWHQLCFLDIRTCEVQGPRPTVRKDDFDTRLPLNVDDAELYPNQGAAHSTDRWTDNTFSLIRFECNEMFRTIWVDRPRIEKRQISLTALLSKVETFRKEMSAKYDHLMDDKVPLQKAAKTTKALLIARTHIMILHRYHNSVEHKMPTRLRQMMVSASVLSLECGIALEVIPELSIWSWYVGAYTQYHAAFLLLVDISFFNQKMECDRIWNCLNYIFQTDQNTTREERAKKILQEIQEKTTVYAQRRKMRAPPSMIEHVNRFGSMAEKQTGEGFNPLVFTSPPSTNTPASVRSSGSATAHANVSQLPSRPQNTYSPALGNPANMGGVASSSLQAPYMPVQPSPTSLLEQDDLMADIDWDAFDALFPPDQAMGDLYTPEFSNMTFVY